MHAVAVAPGVLLAIACAGCGFKGTQSPPGDADSTDVIAEGDAPADAADAAVADGLDAPADATCVSFSQQVNTCALTFGGDLVIAGPAQYNTESGVFTVNGTLVTVTHQMLTTHGVPVDAILAHDVTLTMANTLHAFGGASGNSRPLAIIASGTVTIGDNAVIDVSDGGAGAHNACSTPPHPGASVGNIGGGGGGGGFAEAGGRGGNGNIDGTAAAGGDGAGTINVTGPEGGCPGAPGGTGSGGAVGAGGQGGGAIYIAAAGRIQLGNGAILQAGGGGGHGGIRRPPDGGDAGGGGGGAGGMILLEAPHIVAPTASLVANGGGGGEGSTATAAGNDGQPGTITTAAARGGNGGPVDGGDGGDGGALMAQPGQNAPASARRGGGGGGGSAGYIFILSPDRQLSATISPPPRFSL